MTTKGNNMTTTQTWRKHNSHNVELAKITDAGDLFGEYVDALDKADRLAIRWPNGSRSLYCAQAWLKGIKARSRDLDPDNDMGIRGGAK